MGGAAPGPGLRLIDQPVHRTNRTKSYGARNPPTETVGESGPKFLSSRVSRPWLPGGSRPNAPEPRRSRRVRSWTPVRRKAGGGAEGNRTPDLRVANNQANPSRCFPNMIFPQIFRCLARSRRMFSFLNVPATSMHGFTGITHAQIPLIPDPASPTIPVDKAPNGKGSIRRIKPKKGTRR